MNTWNKKGQQYKENMITMKVNVNKKKAIMDLEKMRERNRMYKRKAEQRKKKK